MRTVVLVVSTLLLAPAVMAQEQPTPAPQAQPEPPKEKKICRSETSTGSMMMTRICHTKAEWAAVDAQHQAMIERTRNGSDGMSPN